MASTIDSGTAAGAPSGGPARKREVPRSAALPLDLLRRFLIAREGSIVVVTILLTLYFIVSLPSSSHFVSSSNFTRCSPTSRRTRSSPPARSS